MQYFWWFVGILSAGYLIIVVLMYFLQSTMIYYPEKRLSATPERLDLKYKDVFLRTADQKTLHGWFVPSESAEITVLYFHGNAGNISGRLETIALLNNLVLNVFIIDYRGYGQSEGMPSEKGTYLDAAAAWQYLIKERSISEDNIVIMGRSLGGAIAAQLASRKNPAATIIESTFTSASDLGAELYPWLPVRTVLKYKYPTIEFIKAIKVPTMLAHSRDDELIPYHHGRTLYDAASKPKVFVDLTGFHGSGFLDTGVRYKKELQSFLETYTSYKKNNK